LAAAAPAAAVAVAAGLAAAGASFFAVSFGGGGALGSGVEDPQASIEPTKSVARTAPRRRPAK
jgi:hypothetical protein